jgi:hypothetical protein
MLWLIKGVEGEKDNPTRIDRDNPTKTLLYNPKGCVCKTYLTFTLPLKQICKSSICTQKNNRSSHSAISITRDSIMLNELKDLT